ncbi:hypothetical protein BH09SUM1_BH09SUM1_07310 [soil metagenome]
MKVVFAFIAVVLASAASAATTFNFDTAGQLGSSPLVTGDTKNFIQTAEHPISGTGDLRFDYSTPDPFQSWTYDIPFAMNDGTISVWFYDALGGDTSLTKYGGSVILEDKDTPGDFLALEIWNGPYPNSDFNGGNKNYYLSRGTSSTPAVTFRSNYFGDRGVGWHQLVFTITPSGSTASVDGVSNLNGASATTGPGSADNLRIRFMAWSASHAGSANWTTNPPLTFMDTLAIPTDYTYFDDLTITATTPAANTVTEGFELSGTTPTYDAASVFMTSAAHDNPNMKNFVPQWGINTAPAQVHSGAQSFHFVNSDPLYKSVLFNLSSATPGDVTLSFYDALGDDRGFNKVGGAVVIEKISDPRDFIALEIWNAPYPTGDTVKNYFLTHGSSTGATAFDGAYFGDRSVGNHTVTIHLTATTSQFVVDGVQNAGGSGIVSGPGISSGIRLRLMADSPSIGGFSNWASPAFTELDYLAFQKTAPYIYYDDLVIPVTGTTAANDTWQSYE